MIDNTREVYVPALCDRVVLQGGQELRFYFRLDWNFTYKGQKYILKFQKLLYYFFIILFVYL